MSAGQKQAKPGRRIGPAARAEAMDLLAQGFTITAVAAEMKVKRDTIVKWRDTVEGQRTLAAARLARLEGLTGAADRSRSILESGATQAAEALVELVANGAPKDRIRAAATLLDRVGVPRVAEVQTRTLDAPDLSKLTDAELAEWERLSQKVNPS